MHLKKSLSMSVLLLTSSIAPLMAERLISGNAQPEEGTFSFAIGHTLSTYEKNQYFIAADCKQTGTGRQTPIEQSAQEAAAQSQKEADTTQATDTPAKTEQLKFGGLIKDYALAYMNNEFDRFMPLAPEKISINGVEADNPFYDNGVLACTLMQKTSSSIKGLPLKPVLVSASDPQTIYLLNVVDQKPELISAEHFGFKCKNIVDSQGLLTSGIISLQGASSSVFALVKPTDPTAQFGDRGSGIAHILLGLKTLPQDEKKDKKDEDKPEEKKQTAVFAMIDPSGREMGRNCALPLDRTSPAIKIEHDLAHLENPIMHWAHEVRALYVGMKATAGNEASAGARALAVGHVDDRTHVFTLTPIAPDSAFKEGVNTIVGGKGANTTWNISQIKTIQTSTSLFYVVVGDEKELYALPLVGGHTAPKKDHDGNTIKDDKGNEIMEFTTLNGTIAKKSAIPEDVYPFTITNNNDEKKDTVTVKTNIFHGTRFLKEPAVTPEDMTTADDPAARIGCGPIPHGTISSMVADTDTVYVSVLNSPENKPGAYYSQALFDEVGKIKGWTAWMPLANINKPVNHLWWDSQKGTVTYLVKQENGVTVKQTIWSKGDVDKAGHLVELIEKEFPVERGGIQGLFIADTSDVSCAQTIIATGLRKVVCVCADEHNKPIGEPIIFTSDVLDKLGPINAVALAFEGKCYRLVVGGVGGVAMLNSTAQNFSSIRTYLESGSFEKFGDYRHVRSLIIDGNGLYILTTKQFDRVQLDTKCKTTLANTAQMHGGAYFDCLVSGPLAILGTSKGLYRSGNGIDVRVASDLVNWTMIPVPEAEGAVTQLIPITTTGKKQDLVTGVGSNLYVLSSHKEHDIAHVHRYTIAPVDHEGVNDATIQHFPDYFVDKRESYFMSSGQEIVRFATDGSLYLLGLNKSTNNPFAAVKALPSYLTGQLDQVDLCTKHSGRRFLGIQSRMVFPYATGSFISAITRSPITGSWIIASDGGLRVNE